MKNILSVIAICFLISCKEKGPSKSEIELEKVKSEIKKQNDDYEALKERLQFEKDTMILNYQIRFYDSIRKRKKNP